MSEYITHVDAQSTGDPSLERFLDWADHFWDCKTAHPEYKAQFYDDRPLYEPYSSDPLDDDLPRPLGSVP